MSTATYAFTERIYVDVSNLTPGALLAYGAGGLSDFGSDLRWRHADTFDLEIVFFDRRLGATVFVSLDAGFSLVVGGKLATGGIPAGDLLFSTTSFSESTDGDLKVYTGTINLNTVAMAAAIAGKTSIQIQTDVEIQNGANTRRKTKSFLHTIWPQSYAGESTPAPGTPVYPSPSALVTTSDIIIPTGKRLRIDDAGNPILEDKP